MSFVISTFQIKIDPTPSNILIVNAVAYIVILALIILLPLLVRMGIGLKDFAINRVMEWRDIGWALLGFIVYAIATVLVTYAVKKIFPGIDMEQTQELGFDSVFGLDRLLAFVMFVVIAPLVEEMIFRGFLQTKLRQSKMPLWLVVFVVSFVFAIAHGQLNVAIDVFILAIVLSLLREKTGSIWASVLVHVMKNGLAFYVLFVMAN